MRTTIDPWDANGYPQSIVSVEVEFSDHDRGADDDDYRVEVSSYNHCFEKYKEIYPHFVREDDPNGDKFYAYNMIPDFKFRHFTRKVCLRGL